MSVVLHKITIGSATYESPQNTQLKEVIVQNAIGIPASSAEVILTGLADFSGSAGDSVSIELGADGSPGKVFTGIVKSIEHTLETVRISATSAMESLTRMRVDAVFENKSCGAIFKELVGLSEATAGTADDGITFPRYIISSGKSIWRHLRELGRYCAADIFTDHEDKFHFVTYKSASGSTFTYGEDVLEMEKEALEPLLDGVEVYGDSPAGQGQSDEATSWLKKQEVVGSSGKTSGVVARSAIYAARNKDLCDSIAENLFNATQSTAVGRSVVLGGQDVALGGTVTFKDMPASAANGSYKVTSVQHVLNEESGFTTEIKWEEPYE